MGGLGKTTLAQLVYNDHEIQKHFDLLLWVCVSDSFDVDSLAKSIVKAAPKKKDDGTEEVASKKKKTPLDILQNVVSRQRYLLVLDDVWTREIHKWEQLKARLEHGGMGSVVLTTTRDKGVAEIMGTFQDYNLGVLGGEYIKEIIETTAFSRLKKEEERPDFMVNMVGEIVDRCAGSPLAAIALGSILCNKTSEEEWKAVSSRSNICTVESGILPILKLSYNDLPPHMKQCFGFCAIFPKGYEIDVDKLIQLWIAHGFIIQEEQVRLETSGRQIFNELASRSFFQVKQVQTTDDGFTRQPSRTTCKIHDLMHDVALSVMERECAIAIEEPGKVELVVTTEEPSHSEWIPSTARHLYLSCKEPGRKLNSSLQKRSPTIQTLMCDTHMECSLQHLSKYSSLQALQLYLKGSSSFPLKPKHLHHLRYLDLSGSHIKELPEDMSILYTLQTLNLSRCKYLGGLPGQMKYMTALRHLYTHGCPELKSMPKELGKLTSLQTLTCFAAGSDSNCSNVGDLRHLNLGGQLELHHLANVKAEDAKAANLMQKKELRELTLNWRAGNTCEDDARVLEQLKPHDGLHAIRIHYYRATTFPAWMARLQNLVEIHIFSCKRLNWLFSRDNDTSSTFPNLKELTLTYLACLERWWEIDNDWMQGEEIMFPRLEKLAITRCKKLTTLPGHPTFPNLQNVFIEECPELTTTAKSPKLSVLSMEGHEEELFKWVARHMTSLTNLELKSLEENTETASAVTEHGQRQVLESNEKWNDLDFPLAVLVLKDFKSGVTELFACFVHLQDLSIWSCHALVHWPEKEFQGLVSLRKLNIYRCNNLTGYAKAPDVPSTSSQTSQLLPHLESLTIEYCGSLVEIFNVPTTLRVMIIRACNKLKSTSGRRVQQGQSASSIYQGSSSILKVSSSLAGAEHLEELTLWGCDGLTGILHLPQSLKYLEICYCGHLKSLESPSGELPFLADLTVYGCEALSSLPDGPQAYTSLRLFSFFGCCSMTALPTSLQQQLVSLHLELKELEAHYCGNTPSPVLLKPKTWKYAIRRE